MSDNRATDAAISAIVIVVVGVVSVGYGYHRPAAFIAAPPALMILGTYWVVQFLMVGYIARYCEFLEDKINLVSGEYLMSWESAYSQGTGIRFSAKFRLVPDAVHNPLTPLILSVLLGGVGVFLFFVGQGSEALYALLETHHHWAAPWLAVLYGLAFLVWPALVAVEYAYGMRLIAKLGESLDRELASTYDAHLPRPSDMASSSARPSGLAAVLKSLLFRMMNRRLPRP